MRSVTRLSSRAASADGVRMDRAMPGAGVPDANMSLIVEKCSQIIESVFSERISELGGTRSDSQQLAQAAAHAIVAWSAGGLPN
jgi:hypothetical protein